MTAIEEKKDFHAIVDQEEGELFAVNLIDEILTRGQEVLFEKHIESQVLPYAVQFAKDTLVTIVEWEFFKRDNGRIDPLTWTPDEEPPSAVIDSWARGSIPIRNQPPGIPAPAKKIIEVMTPLTMSQESLLSVPARNSGALQPPARDSRASLSSVANKKVLPSRTSLASSSSVKLGNGKGYPRPNSSRRGVLGAPADVDAPLSATALAEHAIIDENKRTLARLQNIEKDGGKVDVSYDNDGKLMIIKKTASTKLPSQGLQADTMRLAPGVTLREGDIVKRGVGVIRKVQGGLRSQANA
ncbi:hypothetical protein HK101_012033 [Irineochytrium annulatum]|nr:hypothetical protein HK101_012033 [Irineochytrium annulatum]